jgi:heparan-alpha-glucosaminide N-acetyltransferase
MQPPRTCEKCTNVTYHERRRCAWPDASHPRRCQSQLVTPEWFDQAPWATKHPVDLNLPLFATLSGCGLAFALHRRVQIAPLLRCVVMLLATGLLYNAIVLDSWEFDVWRVTGVLQLYAVVVGVL